MPNFVLKLAGCLIGFAACTGLGGNAAGVPRATLRAAQSDPLVGLWGSENRFGPLVRGELVVDARQAEWRATVGGFDVPIRREQNSITFSLPGNLGEFRGHVSAGGKALTGDWIQPVGVVIDNRYATPVHFSQARAGRWTGQVAPLDDEISFYVSIRRTQDGSLTAFIRNPDFNYFRRRTYRIEVNDANVTLRNTQDSKDVITGTYDSKIDHLALSTLDSHPALEFTRRTHN